MASLTLMLLILIDFNIYRPLNKTSAPPPRAARCRAKKIRLCARASLAQPPPRGDCAVCVHLCSHRCGVCLIMLYWYTHHQTY